MKTKGSLFFIFTLFLVLFVAVSSVCATDDVNLNSNNVSDVNTDYNGVSDVNTHYDCVSDVNKNSNEPSFDLEVNNTVYGDNIYINVHNATDGDNLLNGTCYVNLNNITYSFNVTNGEGNCTLYPNKLYHILTPIYINPIIPVLNDSSLSSELLDIDYYYFYNTNVGTYVMNATLVTKDYNIFNNVSFNITKATPTITAYIQDFYYGHYLEYTARVYGGFGELLASNTIHSPYGYIEIFAYYNVDYLKAHIFDEYGNEVDESNLVPGNYSIIVEYIGDENHYSVNSTNSSFEVKKDYTEIFVNNTSVDIGSTTYITIELKNANYCRQMGKVYWTFKPLANAKVEVYFNGNYYKLITDDNGKCKFKVKLNNPGTYDLTVVYEGDDYNQPSNKSVNITANKYSFTINQIIKAAVYLKNYASKNKKLPTTIKVANVKCTISQFSYLMASAIKNINKKKFSSKIDLIPVKVVKKNFKVKVKVYKKDYLKVVNIIQSKGIKCKLPTRINTYGKKIGFNVYTYGLAKILKFYKFNKRLPKYVIFTSRY